MHELPATQGILRVALDAAEGAGGGRIREIELVIGELTSMVDDSVQFYFDLLARGTPAEGAILRFHREPGELRCDGCGRSSPVRAPLPPICPRCGDLRIRVTGGQAFRVDSIDLDPDLAPTPSPSTGVSA
jgi:hydrogenase nickel incorporation protein HypA/HybF